MRTTTRVREVISRSYNVILRRTLSADTVRLLIERAHREAAEKEERVLELREQLAVVLGALAQRDVVIGQLRGELAAAAAEIAELRRQLGQNSRNSSRPPSSDGLAKPAPRSQRRRGVRKAGGQDGHLGSTLAQVPTPDEVIAHEPGCCRGCGDELTGAPEVGREHRQVFDLPPIRPRVIEHQLIKRRCGCGTATSALAPDGVTAPVQYGPRITAIIVYLYVGQFLSRKRTAAALAASISLASIPRCATAVLAAAAAKSLVATPLSTTWRSRIPVRLRIHSSVVSTSFSKSRLVKTRGGT